MEHTESLSPEIVATIARYQSYGWGWRIITAAINRMFATSYTAAELKKKSQQV